jgi:hypothetical protein
MGKRCRSNKPQIDPGMTRFTQPLPYLMADLVGWDYKYLFIQEMTAAKFRQKCITNI